MADMNPDQLPIDLPSTTTKFVADGYTFLVQHNIDLCTIRNRWLERYSLYASLGRDAKSLLTEARRAYEANNQSRHGDVAVILDNLMRGAADLLSRESPILYICTLFINREDEDIKGYDPEFAKEKIESWHRAGIKHNFFLSWALSYLRITEENLNTLTQISLTASLPVLDVLSQPLNSSLSDDK